MVYICQPHGLELYRDEVQSLRYQREHSVFAMHALNDVLQKTKCLYSM